MDRAMIAVSPTFSRSRAPSMGANSNGNRSAAIIDSMGGLFGGNATQLGSLQTADHAL